jgi:hypothetical protein
MKKRNYQTDQIELLLRAKKKSNPGGTDANHRTEQTTK